MDHFIGFDRFLRIVLTHPKTIRFYGPPGLIRNIEGKLAGYTWNLTEDYPLVLRVTELHRDKRVVTSFRASNGFQPEPPEILPVEDELLKEPMISVFATALDHKIPSLAFSLSERFHINIVTEELDKRGYSPGPWIRKLKEAVWSGREGDESVEVPLRTEPGGRRTFKIRDLSPIYSVTRGAKISYVVDTLYSKENEERIVRLASGSTSFFCEAPFLHRDVDQASARYHLTARQAGLLARKAGVEYLQVFHFSPRYAGAEKEIYEEAMRSFKGKE
jgi:ribonuclease Z